ncbi:hypothetical protein HG531_011623 [Fusarium graminearum]|nr:hypothetical protein HG531_011623 [Fusarium graminearum]
MASTIPSSARVVQDRSNEALLLSKFSEGRCDVEFVKDVGIATQLNEILNDMFPEGMENSLFLGTDLGANLVESLSKMCPFGDMERSCGAAGRKRLHVSKISCVSAPNMSNMAESRRPPES